MTPDFVKWLANRWPADSERGDAQWERLRGAIKAPLSSEQQLTWVAALVDLVADRWSASEPRGLATARAVVTFLKTEAAEHEDWWGSPSITIDDVENYLCAALDDIFDDEENISIEKSHEMYPVDENHFDGGHDDDGCAVCRPRWAFQDARDDELKSVVVSMIIRAHEQAVPTPHEDLSYAEGCIHHREYHLLRERLKAEYEKAEKALKDEVRMKLIAAALPGAVAALDLALKDEAKTRRFAEKLTGVDGPLDLATDAAKTAVARAIAIADEAIRQIAATQKERG